MRKYKGGVLGNTQERISDFRSDTLISTTWYMQILEFVGYIVLFFSIIDIMVLLPYNAMFNQGPGQCIKRDDWISFSFLTIPSSIANTFGTKCDERTTSSGTVDSSNKCQPGLGMWSKYDRSKHGVLCAEEATAIYNDAIADNKMGGYNGSEILAYIIIPTLTVMGIIYGLIFTRLNYSEWIFWILITTLVYTGTTSIAESSDIELLPPDQPSPLTYITNKLNFQNTDELQYNFMARKSDGSTCLVEGVMLGGGIHSSDGAPTYTGDCTAETLPLA